MPFRNRIILLAIVLFVIACAPKVIITGNKANSLNGSVLPAKDVLILELTDIADIEIEPIAQLEIKDNGLTTNCGYDSFVEVAKSKAGSMGGNAIIITQNTLPNLKSTCHRIKANVYDLPDPETYRTEVEWSKNRKLRIEDFRGSTEERPFTAATSSGFTYKYSYAPFLRSINIDVNTYFYKRLSYFKRTERDGYVLRHEQVHFDISELYARKFVSRVQIEFANMTDWDEGHEDLYSEIREALYLEQDRYDFEVYADTSLQAGWSSRIAKELDVLSEYEGEKTIVLMRK